MKTKSLKKQFIKKFISKPRIYLKKTPLNKYLIKKQETAKKWILKSIYFNKVNSLHNQNNNYNLKKNKYTYLGSNKKYKVLNTFKNTANNKELKILQLLNKTFLLNLANKKNDKYLIKKNLQNALVGNNRNNLLNIKKYKLNWLSVKKRLIVKTSSNTSLNKKNKINNLNFYLNKKNKIKIKKFSTKLVVQPFKNKFNKLNKLSWFNKFIREGSQLKWFKNHNVLHYKKNKYKYSKRWAKKNIYKNKIYNNDQRRLFRYLWYYNPKFIGAKRFSIFIYKANQLKLKKNNNKFLFLSSNYKQKLIYKKYTKKLIKKLKQNIKVKKYKNFIKTLSKSKNIKKLIYNQINIRRGLSYNKKTLKKINFNNKVKYVSKFKTKKYKFIRRNKRYLFNYLKHKKIKRLYRYGKNILCYKKHIFIFKIPKSKIKSKIVVYNYNRWQVSRKLRFKLRWKRRLKKKWNNNLYFKKMMKYHKQNKFKLKIIKKIPKNLKCFWSELVKPNSYFYNGILNQIALHTFKILKWQTNSFDKYQFIRSENIIVNFKKYSSIKIIINPIINNNFICSFNHNLIKYSFKNKVLINSIFNNKITVIYDTVNNNIYYLNTSNIGYIKLNITNSKVNNFKTFLIKKYNYKTPKFINFKISNTEYKKNNDIFFSNNKPHFYKNKTKKLIINSRGLKTKKILTNLSFFKKIWLSKTLFNISKLNLNLQHNYIYKNQNINNLVKNAVNELHYEENFYGHYDEFSFKWKFFTKKWFFNISRWKRAITFRWLMRKAWNNYRKLQKNFMFIKLFRTNFLLSTGLTEVELLNEWKRVRKGNSNNNLALEQFNKQLQLKMDGIMMLFGLSPNRLIAQELVRCGSIRLNGLVITNPNKFMQINNIIQFDKTIINNVKSLYSLIKWNSIKNRIKYVGFIQTIWSLMLFKFIRLPYKYELFEESILTERWLRFFIRYFPIKISKFKKQKIKWYKY